MKPYSNTFAYLEDSPDKAAFSAMTTRPSFESSQGQRVGCKYSHSFQRRLQCYVWYKSEKSSTRACSAGAGAKSNPGCNYRATSTSMFITLEQRNTTVTLVGLSFNLVFSETRRHSFVPLLLGAVNSTFLFTEIDFFSHSSVFRAPALLSSSGVNTNLCIPERCLTWASSPRTSI